MAWCLERHVINEYLSDQVDTEENDDVLVFSALTLLVGSRKGIRPVKN